MFQANFGHDFGPFGRNLDPQKIFAGFSCTSKKLGIAQLSNLKEKTIVPNLKKLQKPNFELDFGQFNPNLKKFNTE